jgi:DNA repair protein RadA/Sms
MVKNDYGQNLAYQCDSCSRRHPKWQGKCDGCNEWNTIVEKMVYSNDLGSKNDWIKYDDFSSDLIHLDSEDYDYDSIRFDIKWSEIKRAVGGDFVAGSSVLLAGMPGVGKSTLLMQLSSKFSAYGKVIYL